MTSYYTYTMVAILLCLASLVPVQEFMARGLEIELTWKASLCYAIFLFLVFVIFDYFKRTEFAKEKFFFDISDSDRTCKRSK
jgi:hypothetical protein